MNYRRPPPIMRKSCDQRVFDNNNNHIIIFIAILCFGFLAAEGGRNFYIVGVEKFHAYDESDEKEDKRGYIAKNRESSR
jgi:hypothetical protein